MNSPVTARATCLVLAALVTAALLGSLERIAAAQHTAVQLAQQQPAVGQPLAAGGACKTQV